jgi:hypothetical protein
VSTKTHPDDPRISLPPSVVILGNDAQLAARPATPVQLAHACLAAGYRAVVPGSWGDELIAAATIQALGTQDARPAIHCACPHVARRMLAVGSDLSPYLVSLVSPPVAAARYVRHHAQGAVRITYVGRCPGAGDESIDARITPEELLAQLAERGIVPREQPLVFDSVIPPDRRRFRSQPGGLPAPDALWSGDVPTTVEAIGEDDIVSEIAEKILSATNSLLDLAPAVGCACAGARAGEPGHRGRADITALEPPRAPSPVVDEQVSLGLELPLPVAARSVIDLIAPPSTVSEGPTPDEVDPVPPVVESPEVEPVARRPRFTPQEEEAPSLVGRRRISGPTNRVVPGSMPVSSDQEGRVLPRAYVARRRSPRSGVPAIPDQSPPHRIADQPRHTAASAVSVPPRIELPSRPVADSISAPPPADPRAKRDTRSAALPVGEPVRTGDDAVPAPRPVVAQLATDAPASSLRSSDAELPILQSVEPARATNGRLATAAPQSLPLLVDQVRRTTERVSGEVRAIAARRPRMAVVVVLTAVVLLGVVIGYAAAGKRPDDRTSSEAGGQVDQGRSPAPAGPESAAVRAEASRRDSAPRRAATPPRRAAVRRAPQTSGAGATSTSTPDSVSPIAAPAVPPADRSDSLARAAADSVRRAAAKARNDSIAAERDALQKELERRRARLDSIARRVQELKPDQR